MPAYHCFYYTMAPGKIIEGGPGVKAQMTEMEQRHQYAEFIEISGKNMCGDREQSKLASIFKAFSFGASTEINFSDATQKYKEHHQEGWSHVMTSEGYQFDVPQETVFFSYVKMILVRVRLISGVKTFTWPVGEVAKGPANKDDLLDLLNGKSDLTNPSKQFWPASISSQSIFTLVIPWRLLGTFFTFGRRSDGRITDG